MRTSGPRNVYQKERRGQKDRKKYNQRKETKQERSFYLARTYVDGIKINWPLTPRNERNEKMIQRKKEREYRLSFAVYIT